jgi:CheY-like chemotaxis protein
VRSGNGTHGYSPRGCGGALVVHYMLWDTARLGARVSVLIQSSSTSAARRPSARRVARLAGRRATDGAVVLRPKEVCSQVTVSASTLRAWSTEFKNYLSPGERQPCLLDGASPAEYGQSWCTAAWMSERDRRTPVVMFTAHAQDLAEAQLGESARSRRAAFAGIVAKPFDLQVLVDVVARAVRQPTGMDVSTRYLN